jgi:LysR family glycine cleavage system transcriptional activator
MSELRFPSIDGLRAFDAAARLGSFERAADELFITASAVGKRVAAVEELLGTPVFQRGVKPLALTAAGREYLEQVSHALGLLAAMPQHRRTPQPSRRLRICATPTFSRQILVPALESFTAAHPGLDLELQLVLPFLDGGATDADVEVRFGDASLGRPLLADRVLPMAAPPLLQRLPPLRGPRDLAHAQLLRTPLEPWTAWFRAAGLPWPEPTSGPKLMDLGLTLEAAVSGQGVVLGRPTLARHWLRHGNLVPLFAPALVAAEPASRYYLLPHATSGLAPVFADWLLALCADVEREAAAALSGSA